jgi:putative ABC transport system permease protein
MVLPRVQLRKILRDVLIYKARSLLLIVAITAGVAAVGMIVTSAIVLERDLEDVNVGTRPAHAVLTLPDFGMDLVREIEELPYIAEAEGRGQVMANVEVAPGRWLPLRIQAIADVDPKIGRLRSGPSLTMPLARDEVLIERTASLLMNVNTAGSIRIKTFRGTQHRLRVAGLVHDMAELASDISLTLNAYVTPETMTEIEGETSFNQLYVRADAAGANRREIETATTRLTEELHQRGFPVRHVMIPEPDKHIMQDNMRTVLIILGVFAPLTLILSAFLVINVISAVIAQQIPQIGVLKSLGGRRKQILSLYLGTVLMFGTGALILSVPLGLYGAWILAEEIAAGMNFDIVSMGLPWQTVVLQACVALLVPLLAAWIPIRTGARITIREAISGFGISEDVGRGLIGARLSRIRFLRQVTRLSLRNTFRRRGRCALTLVTLSLAGGMFIATLAVRDELLRGLKEMHKGEDYDVSIDLALMLPRDELVQEALSVPGVIAAEGWAIISAQPRFADDWKGRSITLVAIPEGSTFTRGKVTAGQWIEEPGERQLFLGAGSYDRISRIVAEGAVDLEIRGQKKTWKLVGSGARQLFPMGYIFYEDIKEALGEDNVTNHLVVRTEEHSRAFQRKVQARLLTRLGTKGYVLANSKTIAEIHEASESNLDRITGLLMGMVVLLGLVGGMGLAITMGLNVLERTREIGILRSLGARARIIRGMVIKEGILIGWASCLLGALVSIPLGQALGNELGRALLSIDLDYRFPVFGLLLWILLATIVGIIGALAPARRAAHITIREAIAYEG